ncbi:MAG TPA: DUF6526 family protein [Ferruginibacter sp.]|nr:DUF6526 family protein [Ferruginibacter sp.]
MQEQNYKNHSRLVPVFHYLGYLLVLAVLVGSFVNLNYCIKQDECLYTPILICLTAFVLIILTWYTRYFALRAQDRAIRAEENLRYFAITGKLLDTKLTMAQIVALRFAPNNEFVDLAHRAVEENLRSADIKKAIKNWKVDHDRV